MVFPFHVPKGHFNRAYGEISALEEKFKLSSANFPSLHLCVRGVFSLMGLYCLSHALVWCYLTSHTSSLV